LVQASRTFKKKNFRYDVKSRFLFST